MAASKKPSTSYSNAHAQSNARTRSQSPRPQYARPQSPRPQYNSRPQTPRSQTPRPQTPRPQTPRPQTPRPMSPIPHSTIPGHGHNKTVPHLQLQNPIDGPLARAKDEWKNSESWFGIEDCGRLLDVPETFGGTQTLFKWPCFMIILGTVAYLWGTYYDDAWFLGHLDHWALFVSLLYSGMSLANGHFRPPQPAEVDQGLNAYLKVFWITFEVAAHLELLTSFLYWVVGFHREHDGEIGYDDIMLHGGVLVLVWIDGMAMNRIPVRIKHYFIVLAFDSVYVIWTVLHAVAGLGNGKEESETTGTTDAEEEVPNESDAIYIALDWKDETLQTIFLMVGIFTVIAPLCFIFQYLMSLYSFPWVWNGSKSRKCVDMHFNTVHRAPQNQPTAPPNYHNTLDQNSSRNDHVRSSSRMGDSTRRTNTTIPMGDGSRDRPTSPTPREQEQERKEATKKKAKTSDKRSKPRVISATPKNATSETSRTSALTNNNNNNDDGSSPKRKATKSKTKNKTKKSKSNKREGTRGPKNKNLNRQLSKDTLSLMDIA